MDSTTTAPAPQIVEGINDRAFLVLEGLTLKQRNAARKELELEGWTLSAHGSNRHGWTLHGWKGERPYVTRHTFDLRHAGAGNSITPLYRSSQPETILETIIGEPSS